MPNKKKKDFSPHIPLESAPPCDIAGCVQAGAYKAPRSREHLHDYRWYCLDHIREHNQKWDFFAGMDEGEIETFIRDAVTGHRPTWSRESHLKYTQEKLQDALYAFLNEGKKAHKATPALPVKLRKALAAMNMEYPYTAKALKVRYRELVKKHHPDVNKGDKQSEEMFKQITAAFHTLSEHIKHS